MDLIGSLQTCCWPPEARMCWSADLVQPQGLALSPPLHRIRFSPNADVTRPLGLCKSNLRVARSEHSTDLTDLSYS